MEAVRINGGGFIAHMSALRQLDAALTVFLQSDLGVDDFIKTLPELPQKCDSADKLVGKVNRILRKIFGYFFKDLGLVLYRTYNDQFSCMKLWCSDRGFNFKYQLFIRNDGGIEMYIEYFGDEHVLRCGIIVDEAETTFNHVDELIVFISNNNEIKKGEANTDKVKYQSESDHSSDDDSDDGE